MNQTKLPPARSFTEEGTVFWLIVTAILLSYLTIAISAALYTLLTPALAIVQLVLAYACWTRRKWGFLASTVSGILIAGLAFGILYSPVGDLLLLLQLQIILFAYRAHRELRKIFFGAARGIGPFTNR